MLKSSHFFLHFLQTPLDEFLQGNTPMQNVFGLIYTLKFVVSRVQ